MKIFGLTKIRNEEEIIQDTLDHWGKVCSGGIFVYDDASTDRTPEICRNHPAVKELIRGKEWDPDRERAEWTCRQAVLAAAKPRAQSGDWFVAFDADERIFLKDRIRFFAEGVQAIACELYDVYITPEDIIWPYGERNWVGPEYRTIVFFFKNSQYLKYEVPDQRVVNLGPEPKLQVAGVIKHFGKGISVQHWEATCDYYIQHFPKYAEKWRLRKGKAVKRDYLSDFGNPLVKFSDVLCGVQKGIPLELQPYGKN